MQPWNLGRVMHIYVMFSMLHSKIFAINLNLTSIDCYLVRTLAVAYILQDAQKDPSLCLWLSIAMIRLRYTVSIEVYAEMATAHGFVVYTILSIDLTIPDNLGASNHILRLCSSNKVF
jgi:hypothetical protein